MSTEAAILKNLFPPAGAVPLACIDRIDKIRAHIQAAIELADGSQPATLGRVCNPVSSEALTLRIVALKESPEGAGLCWREIGPRLGITADAASKRYQKFCKTREAEELRREGYEALSGQITVSSEKTDIGNHFQESPEMVTVESDQMAGATLRESRIVEENEKVPETRGLKNLKIPHTEDEFIDHRRSEGAVYSTIQAELNARGIVCNVDDVVARHHQYKKRQDRDAAGKKPHNTPTPKEAGKADHPNQSAPPEAPATAEQAATESKPEPKAISRAALDAKIWALHKAGKSVEEISDELYAEGLYFSKKSVRVRLISQGAEL